MSLFGWSLPPGCSSGDIERAMGPEAPGNCLNPDCGVELTEDNDPNGDGVCSDACSVPALRNEARLAAEDRRRDDELARYLETLGPEVEAYRREGGLR